MRKSAALLFALGFPSAAWGQVVFPSDIQQHTADLMASRAEYRSCIQEGIVKLGRDNNEDAEIILRAVRALCSESEATVRSLLGPAGAVAGQGHVERVISGDREAAENIGMANLLLARSAREEAP